MSLESRSAIALAVLLALSGCASLPPERGYAEAGALIQARRDAAPTFDANALPQRAPIPTEAVTIEQSVLLAFAYNPQVREKYARLGLGRAELEQARRLSNPQFGFARLSASPGSGTQITRSLSWQFSDLLLWSARERFARGELQRLQESVASELSDLATAVEIAWYAAVGALQVAAMRDVVARSAEASAALAQRYFDAGNISRLQLEQEYAAAALARIAGVRAGASAVRARAELATLIGLPSNAAWTLPSQLTAPSDSRYTVDVLVPLALEQRLDLAAARTAVTLHEDTLGVTRRWRWLGSVEAGYERESEADGGVLRGPSLSLELPIFNQGQASIARAEAGLLDARARLDGLLLSVRNAAELAIAREATAYDIAERYRTALVPRREAIVARTQERVNFMLQGVFELITARQQEYDAYQEYLEAVRDYWIVRAELRGIVGGRLPDDDASAGPTLGVESIIAPPAAATGHAGHGGAMDHSGHDAAMDHSGHGADTPDPHSGHTMPPAPQTTPRDDRVTDPHAGHAKPTQSTPDAKPARPVPGSKRTSDEHGTHEHGDRP
jgi:cobalt-zinc-cadmium efflux system outer membrane protein